MLIPKQHLNFFRKLFEKTSKLWQIRSLPHSANIVKAASVCHKLFFRYIEKEITLDKKETRAEEEEEAMQGQKLNHSHG